MKKKILLLDLCGSLVKENTTFAFLERFDYVRRKSLIFISLYLIYKFTKFDLLRRWAIAKLKGVPKTILRKQAKIFVKECHYNDAVLNLIEEEDFDEIYIVSATLDFIAEEFYSELNYNGFYATCLDYLDSVATGKIKVDLLNNKENIINIISDVNKSFTMISDNFGDLNMMKKCDVAIAVANNKKAVDYWVRNGIEKIIKV
ncbi:hypothetical protein [Escherichia coli]|uniref:hypothetical protein n=1 Tax=Escherichia coli TaxID=562 RepID=UPI001365745F|nr:hypothetical protein [Escherichia coli]MWT73320.1 hypothetical protein [Escherichia coli]